MAGGALLTLPLAFLFASSPRRDSTASISLAYTVLGVTWIGLGLAHLVLSARSPRTAGWRSSPS